MEGKININYREICLRGRSFTSISPPDIFHLQLIHCQTEVKRGVCVGSG